MRVLVLHFPRLGIQLARLGRPDLAGRPLALVDGEGDMALLSAVSPEATAEGVEAGMTPLQARQRCPGAVLLSDNAAHCLDTLAGVVSILRTRTTTDVAILSRNEIGLSLEGLAGRFADEGSAAQGILALARSWSGLAVRAAVGSNVDSARCAAARARRYPTHLPDEESDGNGLPRYFPVSAAFTFEARTSGEAVRVRIVRMLGTLGPVMEEFGQSFRTIRVEYERAGRSTSLVVRPQRPIDQAGQAIEALRPRLNELDGVTAVRVTLDGPGPRVAVSPWRAPVATVHELGAPVTPVQRRLLRAS